jgi:hypothetical protein
MGLQPLRNLGDWSHSWNREEHMEDKARAENLNASGADVNIRIPSGMRD